MELLKPSTAKRQTVRKFPEPTTIKHQVQEFSGLRLFPQIYHDQPNDSQTTLSDFNKKRIPCFGTLKHFKIVTDCSVAFRDLLSEENGGRTTRTTVNFKERRHKKNIETIQSERTEKTYNKKEVESDSSNVQRRRSSSHPKDSDFISDQNYLIQSSGLIK
ncbi:hypothetical protein TNIN_15631 [Trichonephila inaurata madagascariensis]|uniref:Uncharacterized protein n=1 Tax=Trichonephila inaurata madagascariensis TaxID=2747483 RepID=A0A8X7CSA1_9ARAC|nr:hypothetical protein TNIN_15631 [Trichonephila inaurata madagascariensis]